MSSRLKALIARVRASPRELRALLAVAAVLAVAWALVVPPFQGPDEITHVSYAQQLAETGEGPAFDTGKYAVSSEIGVVTDALNLRSIIGISSARPAQSQEEIELWEKIDRTLTDEERQDGTGPSPLARNPQLYYAYEGIPYVVLSGGNILDQLMGMRLFNAALFVLTVLLTWLLATEVFGRARRREVTLATAIVALWPMMTFMAGVVNPDTALATAYTLVALLGVRLVRRGPTLRRVLALALAGAVCLLVHGRGAAAVIVIAVAILVAAIAHRTPVRRVVGWGALGALLAIVPLAASRLLLPKSTGTSSAPYGGEVNFNGGFNLRQFVSQTWQFYLDRLSFMSPKLGPDYGYRQVVVERWVTGVFAGLELTYPTWVYDLVQYGIIAVIVAAYTAAVIDRERLRRAWPVLAVVVALVAGLMLLLHLAAYRALVTGPDPLITGRYLLPLTPIAALFLAWLAGTLPRRAQGVAAVGLIGILLLLQLGGLGMTLVRFHA